MKRIFALLSAFIFALILFGGCSGNKPDEEPTLSLKKTKERKTDLPQEKALTENEKPSPFDEDFVPDGKGVIYFTVMVHLEGWSDEKEGAFNRHSREVINTADLFEKYGARLTLESKEFTQGCLLYENVLKQMEERGHAVGLHADVGGSKKTTYEEMCAELVRMKAQLEELGVTVRHVSGVCSDKDWVTASINAGFEAVTGAVSYGLWALDEGLRPEGFEPYKNPQAGHAAWPWETQGALYPWRAEKGANWIIPSEEGNIIIFPSGMGLDSAYEETQESGGEHVKNILDANDLELWEQELKTIVTLSDSRHLNTYYAAWSLGSAADLSVLEEWLQMVDRYVQNGQIVWSTIPEMIDLYYGYEDSQ